MSVRCMAWVFDHSQAKANDRLVLLAIADEANDDGTDAYPSQDTIAAKTLTNKRTVQRCLDSLQAAGELVVVLPERQGRGHFSRYIVAMGRSADELAERVSTCRPSSEREKARKGAQRRASLRDSRQTQDPRPSDDSLRSSSRALVAVENASTDVERAVPSFDDFWSMFPRKTGKRAARAAFDRACKRAEARVICNAAWRLSKDPNLPELQFVPHPATWLNQDRWEDDPLPARSNGERSTRLQRNLANAAAFIGEG